jgi:hypothetical protein
MPHKIQDNFSHFMVAYANHKKQCSCSTSSIESWKPTSERDFYFNYQHKHKTLHIQLISRAPSKMDKQSTKQKY